MSQASNQWFMDKGNSCDCRHDLTAIVDFYRLLYISGLVLYNHRFLFRKVNNLPQVHIKLNIETARYRAHLTSISENHYHWNQSTTVMYPWLPIDNRSSYARPIDWYWLINWIPIINYSIFSISHTGFTKLKLTALRLLFFIAKKKNVLINLPYLDVRGKWFGRYICKGPGAVFGAKYFEP